MQLSKREEVQTRVSCCIFANAIYIWYHSHFFHFHSLSTERVLPRPPCWFNEWIRAVGSGGTGAWTWMAWPLVLRCHQDLDKVSFWKIEQNKMIQPMAHLKTVPPSCLWPIEWIRGLCCSGCGRLVGQCCAAVNPTQRRWAIICVCTATHTQHKISPLSLRTSSISVVAMCCGRRMICNTCFGCCRAFDVSGRHGLILWRDLRGERSKRRRAPKLNFGIIIRLIFYSFKLKLRCRQIWIYSFKLKLKFKMNYAKLRFIQKISLSLLSHLSHPPRKISRATFKTPWTMFTPDTTPYTHPLPPIVPSVIDDAVAAADSAINVAEMAWIHHHFHRMDAPAHRHARCALSSAASASEFTSYNIGIEGGNSVTHLGAGGVYRTINKRKGDVRKMMWT